MKIAIIYKIINKIDHKVYIGFTKNLLCKRRATHKLHFQQNKPYCLYRAMRKHGWDNFEWEIIYQSLDQDHTLHIMEPFFIKKYNTKIPNGYNMTDGGEGRLNPIITEETRKRISESAKGRPGHWTGKKLPYTIHNKDAIIYTFEHKDGRIFIGTQRDFINTYNQHQANVNRLINGLRKSVGKGWKLKNDKEK